MDTKKNACKEKTNYIVINTGYVHRIFQQNYRSNHDRLVECGHQNIFTNMLYAKETVWSKIGFILPQDIIKEKKILNAHKPFGKTMQVIEELDEIMKLNNCDDEGYIVYQVNTNTPIAEGLAIAKTLKRIKYCVFFDLDEALTIKHGNTNVLFLAYDTESG